MNIDSATGMSGMNFMPRPQNVSLTDEQKEQAAEIISAYDPANLSREDMESIREQLQEAGIGPGDDLKAVFEDQGFEMKGPEGRGGSAPQGPPPGPPPPQRSEEETSAIEAFLEKYDSGEVTDEDVEDLVNLLRDRGSSSTGVLFEENA